MVPTVHRIALLLPCLLAACATGGGGPPNVDAKGAGAEVSGPARAWDARSAQALHAALLPHVEEIRACVDAAAAKHPVRMDDEPSGSVVYDPETGGYVARHRPTPEQAWRPAPFTLALEACLEERLAGWTLPAPATAPSDAELGFHVWLYPTSGAAAPERYAPCFLDPEATGLRTVLMQRPGVALELWVAELTRPLKQGGANPNYTREAIEKRVEGEGVYRCLILRTGRHEGCAVLASVRYMDAAILEALATWRMQPSSCNGRAFDRSYRYTIRLKPPR